MSLETRIERLDRAFGAPELMEVVMTGGLPDWVCGSSWPRRYLALGCRFGAV